MASHAHASTCAAAFQLIALCDQVGTSVALWPAPPGASRHQADVQIDAGATAASFETVKESLRPDHGFAPLRLSEWTVEHVARWVATTPLTAEVEQMLRENAINGPVLESLTEVDLVAMGMDKFGWRRQLLLSRQHLIQQLEVRRRPPEWAEIFELSTVCTPVDSPRGLSNPPHMATSIGGLGSVSGRSQFASRADTVSSGSFSPSPPQQLAGLLRQPPTPCGAGPLPQSLLPCGAASLPGPAPASAGPRTATASQERVLVRPPHPRPTASRKMRSPSPRMQLPAAGMNSPRRLFQASLRSAAAVVQPPVSISAPPGSPALVATASAAAPPPQVMHQFKPAYCAGLPPQRWVCQAAPHTRSTILTQRRSPSPPRYSAMVLRPSPRVVSPPPPPPPPPGARAASPAGGVRSSSPSGLQGVSSTASLRARSPPPHSGAPAAAMAWLSWPPKSSVSAPSGPPVGITRPARGNSVGCVATAASVGDAMGAGGSGHRA